MILLAALAVVAATVPLAGGSLRALGDLRLRWGGAVVVAMGVQLLVVTVLPDHLPPALAAAGHLASYALAGAFVAANRRRPGFPLLGLGGLANGAAIATNGGVMPAHPAALGAAGRDPGGSGFLNSAATDDAPLWFLGDVFAVPEPLPLANVFSVGDVLLVVGAAVLLHRVGRARRPAAAG